MAKSKREAVDKTTEQKIKEAAQQVFTQKGYAATRTRDIAEAAGINLALLNYYFRSKEKLFEIIMMEKLARFFGTVAPLFDDPSTTLDQKISAVAEGYIDMLLQSPDLPLFVLSEIRANPERFLSKIPLAKVLESDFFRQLKTIRPDLHPVHFMMNIVSLSVFPFIMKPVLESAGIVTPKTFETIARERKKLIPQWISAMLKP
ncbi:MAG TPA: TetR/AcrR family transcriptional regulator [Ohtaekwangia sp.]|nr:TetR/AcrR family transcriptional regulator [Ohtaekwangia sp.]